MMDCITMFSGGRDSTLAAIRLASQGLQQVLVTITSDHLYGIDRVKKRLDEIATYLVPQTKWVHVVQPALDLSDGRLAAPTCLPCHLAYTLVGVQVAHDYNVDQLAFGYTTYQSEWPEQKPEAVEALATVLDSFGLTLLTPVYDIETKVEAKNRLAEHGISTQALEQKCTIQIYNTKLEDELYKKELSNWIGLIEEILDQRQYNAFHVEETRSYSQNTGA